MCFHRRGIWRQYRHVRGCPLLNKQNAEETQKAHLEAWRFVIKSTIGIWKKEVSNVCCFGYLNVFVTKACQFSIIQCMFCIMSINWHIKRTHPITFFVDSSNELGHQMPKSIYSVWQKWWADICSGVQGGLRQGEVGGGRHCLPDSRQGPRLGGGGLCLPLKGASSHKERQTTNFDWCDKFYVRNEKFSFQVFIFNPTKM